MIRKHRLSDTSLIVHWCSDEFGMIKTVAKGALRPKSAFAGKLDLFFDAEIEFIRSRKSDLHILKELAVDNARFGLRKTWLQTQAAAYFVQLLENTAEKDTPIDEFYDLLRRGLNFLTDNAPTRKAVLHYEKEMAALLGIGGHRMTPYEAIREVYKRMPPLRAELMEKL